MKLQKTILAASLAFAAVGANASGEFPVKNPAHHVISGATASVGSYYQIGVDANGNVIAAGDPLSVADQDALDYLYTQLKGNPTSAAKQAELETIYTDLGGTGSVFASYFANGQFQAEKFVTNAVPQLDIYAADAINGFNVINHNTVSPVYGRNNLTSLNNATNGIDLNSRKAVIQSEAGQGAKYQLVKYGTEANGLYQFYEMDATGAVDLDKPAFGGQYYSRLGGNSDLVKVNPVGEVDKTQVVRAGQYTISKTGSGEEIKLLTDEHLTYGFKSTQNVTGQGNLVVPGATSNNSANDEKINAGTSVEGVTGQGKSTYDYVNVGVVANTYDDNKLEAIPGETAEQRQQRLRDAHYANPDKSIYGVSAERHAENGVRNITTLTGYGLALSNLGTDPNAKLNFDGSVTRNDGGVTTGFPIVTQYYENLGGSAGQNIVKTLSSEGPQYFTANAAGQLTLISDASTIERLEGLISNTPEATLTGTTIKKVGSASVTEHNVVTNTMTQYYKETEDKGNTTAETRVTNPDGTIVKNFNYNQGSDAQVNVSYARLGILNIDGVDQHGIRVYNGAKESTGGAANYANLTAQGLVTNGKVDAKEFFLDGKKIDFSDLNAGGGNTGGENPGEGGENPGEGGNTGGNGVTAAQVDAKVEASAEATLTEAKTYTDTKVEGAIKTASEDMTNAATQAATQAATAKVDGIVKESAEKTLASANAYTDGKFNQVNKRLDDVEKTANRGVAIALAAQQAVPNVQPGQVAVFGGVGHYEGETAVSLGAVTSFTDRVSASGAFGFSEGSTFGGRVGVSYLFGGK